MSSFTEAMKEVLSHSKYNFINGKYESLMEKIQELILKFLEFIFNAFNINFDPNAANINVRAIANIFVVIAAVMLVIIISFVIYLVIRRRKRSLAQSEIFDEYRLNKLTFDELMNQSSQCETDGNFKQAVRFQYIGLIMLISQADIVYITDAMTGGQFIREVLKKAPTLSPGVRSTVNMYYMLFFGNKTVSSQDYSNHKTLFDNTVEEAKKHE